MARAQSTQRPFKPVSAVEPGGGAAEAEFVRVYAITDDPVTAYKKSGYPLVYKNGHKMPPERIVQLAQELAGNQRIKSLVAASKRDVISHTAAEWTRDEVLEGYRKLYKLATDHVLADVFNASGEVTGIKYSDKAAGNAIAILEKITRIYGFDAPVKVDGTVTFIWGGVANGSQAPTAGAEQRQDKQYDYTGEAADVQHDVQGGTVGDTGAAGTETRASMAEFAV